MNESNSTSINVHVTFVKLLVCQNHTFIVYSPMIDENATSFVARPDGAEITFVSSSGSDVIPTGSIVKLGTQINMIISIIGENQGRGGLCFMQFVSRQK